MKEPGQTLLGKILASGVVSGMWQHLPPQAKAVYAAAEVAEAAIRADERAKATAIERKRCAKVADKWVTPEQRQFGEGGPAAAIRAGEKP